MRLRRKPRRNIFPFCSSRAHTKYEGTQIIFFINLSRAYWHSGMSNKLDSNKIFSGRQPRQDVKVFRRFGNLTPSPFSECVSFGATKPPAHPENGDGIIYRNVGSHPDAGVCPRKIHSILSPRRLQNLYSAFGKSLCT
jgi:hypothetical protein